MKYVVESGRVRTRALEIHLTDHCNLRCKGCCTLSPFLPERHVDPERLRADLALARRGLLPEFLTLTGGEPLLHPRIVDCLRVAKAAGLASTVSVTTNGVLLPRMPDEFWIELDRLTLSVYPGIRLAADLIRSKCEEHGVELRIKRQDEFEDLTLDEPRADDALTWEVYSRCWMKRRCHLLRDGVFYTCTRPPHFAAYFRAPDRFGPADGVRLHDGPGLLRDLLWYLEREEPLASCRLCWGGQGKRFPHVQISPISGKEIASDRTQ